MNQSITSATVGDIKYSMLEPDKFEELNGPGWVPMMGQYLPVNCELALFTGMKKLPDARGVFLRGMNLGRSSKTGDTNGRREVGSYQRDELKSHNHEIRTDREMVAKHSKYKRTVFEIAQDETIRTQKTGGPETRPRNIAVFTYIKID